MKYTWKIIFFSLFLFFYYVNFWVYKEIYVWNIWPNCLTCSRRRGGGGDGLVSKSVFVSHEMHGIHFSPSDFVSCAGFYPFYLFNQSHYLLNFSKLETLSHAFWLQIDFYLFLSFCLSNFTDHEDFSIIIHRTSLTCFYVTKKKR